VPRIKNAFWASGGVTKSILTKLASGWSDRIDPALAAAILTTWVALVPRLVPSRLSDRGIFVSVGARLLAGDRLYSGVYDNKEPLFYYFVAGQLELGRWSEVAAEVLLIAIAAFAAYFMAVKLASQWTAVATSFIAVPIILTGEFYWPGYTELPGIALVLTAMAASAYQRPALAGLCIGLLVFTKLVFVAIALFAVSCFCRKLFDFVSVALGASISAALILTVLFARGELSPFVQTIKLNIAYSEGGMIGSTNGLDSLATHLKLTGGWSLLAETLPILLTILLGLIALALKSGRNNCHLAIVAAGVLSFVGSLIVLSITGLWEQHRHILYIPAIVALLGVTSLLDVSAKIARLRTLALVFLIGYLMAGTLALKDYIKSILTFRESYAALNELSPEARGLLAIASSGTYARFGRNDDLGHAVGLGNWKLACPRFHQYTFEPTALLDDVFKCASASPTLIIAASMSPKPDWPSWNEFVVRVDRLTEGYSCDASSGLRICTRVPKN
jgi:hypothetical protein